jgi:hypothetical protein
MKSVTRPLAAFGLISFFLSLGLAAQQTPPPSRPTPSAPQTQTSVEPAASGQEKNAQVQGQGTPPPASRSLRRTRMCTVRAAREKLPERRMTGFSLRCQTS